MVSLEKKNGIVRATRCAAGIPGVRVDLLECLDNSVWLRCWNRVPVPGAPVVTFEMILSGD